MLKVMSSTESGLDERAAGESLVTGQEGPPPRSAGRLHVDRIQDLAGFAALSLEWDALLERSGERSPFLTWEWLYPWWQHLGRDKELYLLTVRDTSGQLVGLAPLCRSWTGLGIWDRRRVLEFLGTGDVASDYLNIIVDPSPGCTVLAALVEYLVAHHAEWDMLSLTDVDEKAWALSMIRTLFQTRGFDAVTSTRPGHSCPYTRLDGGWDGYLQSRSSNFRRQLKRKHDRLMAQPGARFETIDRAEELPRAIETLITLHRGRRATRGGTTALEDGSVVAFLRAATPLLQERRWLRLCALVAGGRPLAMLYGLAYRDTFYFYQSGWDVDWSALAPGMVLHGWCIQHACAEGLSEYDFLRGEESYKARWAPYVRRTTRLDIVQRTPRTMIYRGTRRLVRGLREVRHRLRGAIGGP